MAHNRFLTTEDLENWHPQVHGCIQSQESVDKATRLMFELQEWVENADDYSHVPTAHLHLTQCNLELYIDDCCMFSTEADSYEECDIDVCKQKWLDYVKNYANILHNTSNGT